MTSNLLRKTITITPAFSKANFSSTLASQATALKYFQQEPPTLGNDFLEGSALRSSLKYLFEVYQKGASQTNGRSKKPVTVLNYSTVFGEVERDLTRFSERCNTEIAAYGDDSEKNPPKFSPYDGWGRRIDHIQVARGWERLSDISAEEGLVAIAYERKYGAFSRVYQFAKMNIFVGPSAVFGCPLSMGDGAARLIEVELKRGNELNAETVHQMKDVYSHLTSRDPKYFWTSGQWMTEKTGGSDVGQTETLAYKTPDSNPASYSLTGYKFFTSATTSQVSFALARIVHNKNRDQNSNSNKREEEEGEITEGSRGLSVFLIKLRDDAGKLQNIYIHRLKDKLGTKAVPTAELELNGTAGTLVSRVGRGVASIASMFNITRIHNSIHASGSMRRAIMIVRDYAQKRVTFGKKLSEHPLFVKVLSQMETTYRGNLLFTLELALLQGKHECEESTEEEDALLRVLTPLMKMYTAKDGFYVVHEALESLGGLGYMEDATVLPRLLRDAQVGTIWEGATNIMALDLLRVLSKHPQALTLLRERISQRLKGATDSQLQELAQIVSQNLKAVLTQLNQVVSNPIILESGSREFSFAITSIYIASLLIDCSQHKINTEGRDNSTLEVLCAKHWIQDKVSPLVGKKLFVDLKDSRKELDELELIAFDKERKSKL